MYSPTLDEFLKLAAQGNLIPVSRRLLADIETPLSAYRKIRGPGEAFLFESVEGGEHIGRYSFVGCNPRAIIRQTGAVIEVLENGKVTVIKGGPTLFISHNVLRDGLLPPFWRRGSGVGRVPVRRLPRLGGFELPGVLPCRIAKMAWRSSSG